MFAHEKSPKNVAYKHTYKFSLLIFISQQLNHVPKSKPTYFNLKKIAE